MTGRLYYQNSYIKDFHASVIETAEGGCRVYLDRTAFYPDSGGQPHDTGSIAGAPVIGVIDEDGRIAHLTGAPVSPGEVHCRIDWARRFDHMQQHTGQHLLSAVLAQMHGAQTVGFHLGAESSAIDVAAGALSEEQISAAENRANELVFENRSVSLSFEEAAQAEGLRKPSGREGTLRVITIEDLDRSACGGTHVRATGEIGPVFIRKVDRAHGNVRIEFLCGGRAVRRARSEFEALARIARTFSAAPEDTPALVVAQAKALEATEKSRRKLAAELAQRRGRELYESTAPDAAGLRHALHRIAQGSFDEEMRAMAQGFTSGPGACLVAIIDDPPSLLLAASKEASIHAGNVLKEAVAALGGRGGGSAQIAQGSVPSRDSLDALVAAVRLATSRLP
jgi:alanyl-tRNA synthetase